MERHAQDPTKDLVLVSDVGNVQLFFDHGLICERLNAYSTMLPDEIKERVFDTSPYNSPINRFEREEMDPFEFLQFINQSIVSNSHRPLTMQTFLSLWNDIFTLNQPVLDLHSRVTEAGYTLVHLSDTNELHADYFRMLSPILYRNTLIGSFTVGRMKPSRAMYERVQQVTGHSLERCVYVDDKPENTTAALDAGMRAAFTYQKDNVAYKDFLERVGFRF